VKAESRLLRAIVGDGSAFPRPRYDLRARCLEEDPDLFFPSDARALIDAREAKLVCHGCPFRQPCADYATAAREEGIWGGTTDHDRAARRRQWIRRAKRREGVAS
jgi:WhiB family redox-sensing transcriptional regulator